MELLRILALHRNEFLDTLMYLITVLAGESLAIVIICWLYWCFDKKIAILSGLAYFASGIPVQGLKITFRVPRPWVRDPNFQPVKAALSGASGYSFPSGHTQTAASLYSTLFLTMKKKPLCLFFLLLIPAVAFSRMYLGVHTPQDVGFALLISIPITVLIWCFCKEMSSSQCKAFRIITLFLLLMIFILIIWTYLQLASGAIDKENAADGIKSCGAALGFLLGIYIEDTRIHFAIPKSKKSALLRFIVGLFTTLLIQKGLKPIIGTSLPASFIRYCITTLWITAIYPWIFVHFQKWP